MNGPTPAADSQRIGIPPTIQGVDLVVLMEALYQLYDVVDWALFPAKIVEVAARLFPATTVTWHAAETGRGRRTLSGVAPGVGRKRGSARGRAVAPPADVIARHERDFQWKCWKFPGRPPRMGILFWSQTRRFELRVSASQPFSRADVQAARAFAAHVCGIRARLRLLAAAPTEPAVTSTPPVLQADLTHRENEVLRWIAAGKSNPEIATILGLSVRTVYKHVENIFTKLGVESRAAAMLLVLDPAGAKAARHAPEATASVPPIAIPPVLAAATAASKARDGAYFSRPSCAESLVAIATATPRDLPALRDALRAEADSRRRSTLCVRLVARIHELERMAVAGLAEVG